MDSSNLKIGIESTMVPPIKTGMSMVKNYEKYGFDSLWFADHIMSWIPEAIWTPEITTMAKFFRSPNDVYEVFTSMAITACNTKKVYLGTGVTETFRRHPAVLAHIIMSLDHLSKGRVILGIGAGEKENVVPYGIKWEKPVTRLEESIRIIKLLWENEKKVNFDGNFWKLKDAVLSIKPYKEQKSPPIWIAAHGQKMLELTGKLGDGWIPIYLNPKTYKEKLNVILKAAKAVGRHPDEITPSLCFNVIIDDKRDEVDKMLETPIAKNHMLTLSHEHFKQYKISHPLGDNFYGMLDYIPTRYDRETILNAIEKIPTAMCKDFYLNGTPEDVISRIEEYIKLGLKHVILINTTPVCDFSKLSTSLNALIKVLNYFKN
ncbi:hypothetical protein LCGC14_1982040 [marine sediment metagenome]|uniref:Luciferase-like domain-containing protein n=1 Tax=marine sediment metagenome TaxID=412755 RepID=A0A0F9HLV0_9ZZZZ